MINKSSQPSSIWLQFVKEVKKYLKILLKNFEEFNSKYPNLSQIIQLTFIYFFAVVDLTYSVLSTVFSFGYFPEILAPFYPITKAILESPILRIWASPEKVFFLSYVVIEFMVIRSTLKFSKLVKYNILLIFAVLMIQGLMISYWDLLFNRQIATSVAKWAYDEGAVIFTDKPLAIFFFLNTFVLFMISYIYLYFRAIRGKFATFPGMSWLTDSIAFWLRIKTPTMPYGKRKKDKRKK
jgi:hypothetical protein